jgi:hypothetical protein
LLAAVVLTAPVWMAALAIAVLGRVIRIVKRVDLVERYRFWKPVLGAKHGDSQALQSAQARFLKGAAGNATK